MIKSFKCQHTEALADGQFVKQFEQFQDSARIRLTTLEAITSINELRNMRGNRLEYLKGDRKGQYSIRINEKMRICFNWIENSAHDVEIVNYHK